MREVASRLDRILPRGNPTTGSGGNRRNGGAAKEGHFGEVWWGGLLILRIYSTFYFYRKIGWYEVQGGMDHPFRSGSCKRNLRISTP